MQKFDGRKLGRKTLEAMRMQAVRRVHAGESPEVVWRTFGFTRPRIYEWLAKFREGGWDALKARRATGRPPQLTGRMVRWVDRTVTMKNPLRLKFPLALWTRAMIAELITRRHGIVLSQVSVGRLLAQLGLSCQGPLVRALEQNPILVEPCASATTQRFRPARPWRTRKSSLPTNRGSAPTTTRESPGECGERRRW